MTNREKSSRTCIITSVILIFPGVAVLSPEAGVIFFLLSILFAFAGVCLGYKRYGRIAIALIVVGIALTIWRFPDARESYESYIERANENAIRN